MTDPHQLTLFSPLPDHHQRLMASPDMWQCCQFVGIQQAGNGRYFEMRHCPACQSTLNRPVALDEAKRILAEQQAMLQRTLDLMDLP